MIRINKISNIFERLLYSNIAQGTPRKIQLINLPNQQMRRIILFHKLCITIIAQDNKKRCLLIKVQLEFRQFHSMKQEGKLGKLSFANREKQYNTDGENLINKGIIIYLVMMSNERILQNQILYFWQISHICLNVKGIYSKPLTKEAFDLLSSSVIIDGQYQWYSRCPLSLLYSIQRLFIDMTIKVINIPIRAGYCRRIRRIFEKLFFLVFLPMLQSLLYQLQMHQICLINSKTIQLPMSSNSNKDHSLAIPKPKWHWTKIKSYLSTEINGQTVKVCLNPTITFDFGEKGQQRQKVRSLLSVDIEKSLQFDEQSGWNWHKSSNLPIIALKFELVGAQDSTRKYQQPQGLQARIFAVKIPEHNHERNHSLQLEDVGLRGTDRVQIKQGLGIFSGIRFRTTSYINQGVKFHLLVVFYLKDEVQYGEFKNIVTSIISPAIFVDSRKSARDHFEKRFVSFSHIFEPKLMAQQFLKKSLKAKSQGYEIKVQNSLEGLYNYLTAPNIRHKVKHPLFLSVKFSNAFQILYNTKIPKFESPRNIIFQLQSILTSKIGRKRKNDKNQFLTQKLFLINIIGICSTAKKMKIYDCLEFLNCSWMEVIRYNYLVRSHFQNILELGDIEDVYRQCYGELREISGGYGREKIEQEEEEDQGLVDEKVKERRRQQYQIYEKSASLKPQSEQKPLICTQLPNPNAHPKIPLQTAPTPTLAPMSPTNPDFQNVGMLNYSSLIQQIDVQNYLLFSIIHQNNMIRNKLMTDYSAAGQNFHTVWAQGFRGGGYEIMGQEMDMGMGVRVNRREYNVEEDIREIRNLGTNKMVKRQNN